mmetsp:Transcript_7755/g.28391  ORF Transcript_7755/g.28391 Transcript_7755/m.28391 type:complete len:218 (-) Transcript_7755:50-703(-)
MLRGRCLRERVEEGALLVVARGRGVLAVVGLARRATGGLGLAGKGEEVVDRAAPLAGVVLVVGHQHLHGADAGAALQPLPVQALVALEDAGDVEELHEGIPEVGRPRLILRGVAGGDVHGLVPAVEAYLVQQALHVLGRGPARDVFHHDRRWGRLRASNLVLRLREGLLVGRVAREVAALELRNSNAQLGESGLHGRGEGGCAVASSADWNPRLVGS